MNADREAIENIICDEFGDTTNPPPFMDPESQELWQMVSYVIERETDVHLVMTALAIRRELRKESIVKQVYRETASKIRDITSRIGVAATREWIKGQFTLIADELERWGTR